MTKGIGIESPVKMSLYNESRTAKGRYKHPKGRPVGVIAVAPKNYQEGTFNPYVIDFVVNPYRKDFMRVILQKKRKESLSKYSQSLFDSCFKKWKEN